jgi:cyanophycin synthetase
MYTLPGGLNPAYAVTYIRYEAAFARLGARLTTPSGDGFVRALEVGGRTAPYIAEAHLLNSAAAAAIARDKLATYQVLAGAGISVPAGLPFFAEASRGVALRVPEALRIDHLAEVLPGVVASKRVVVKPGMEAKGRGVHVCVGMSEVLDAARDVLTYGHFGLAQAYVPGPEYRVAVLGGEVLVCYAKRPPRLGGSGTIRARLAAYNATAKEPLPTHLAPPFVHGAWGLDDTPEEGAELELLGATNLSRGAAPEPMDAPPAALLDAALRAHAAVGLELSGIDLRWPDRAAPPIVLEVNDNPGFEVLGKLHPATLDAIVARIAAAIVARLR